MSSDDSYRQWAARITAVQQQKMTPVQRQCMKEAADRQQLVLKARAKTYNMQQQSTDLRRKWAGGITSLSASHAVTAPLPAGAYAARCEEVQQEMAHVSREYSGEEAQGVIDQFVALQNSEGGMGEVGAAGNLAIEQANEEVQSALEQLKCIPANEAEQETKFKVYETFAERTEHIRMQLFNFVEENKEALGEHAAQDFQRRLESIDSEQNMGVGEEAEEDVWFVYHMAVQVDRNVVMMNKILEDFDRKLSLLSNQTECPVCLDPFASEGEKRAEVLGCCHSVCKHCWHHLQRLAVGRTLCPMCRYQEFYVAVSGGAPE
eukprot:CAMPEP_0181332578 /NCGR_PEP_ID=MMETSP1101-20121128/25180_1 /TAXON_ID=46948 /ORGANISM="Rhodomonas abbreviata, Strain Caron Lab Isolate" /LENGTH=318 /DNA_ID=CAMNT_0023442255 /DNA_START=111 /DNA_END=1067 /DNA_ORIENTATION=-